MAAPLKKKNRNRTPPFEAYPEWSTARFYGFLRSSLRSASSRWPPKFQCLNDATRPYVGPDKRRKKERQCAICKGWFPTTQTAADHIVPCGQLSSWEDVVPFVQKLFVGPEGFQCLCTECHLQKTLKERDERKDN